MQAYNNSITTLVCLQLCGIFRFKPNFPIYVFQAYIFHLNKSSWKCKLIHCLFQRKQYGVGRNPCKHIGESEKIGPTVKQRNSEQIVKLYVLLNSPRSLRLLDSSCYISLIMSYVKQALESKMHSKGASTQNSCPIELKKLYTFILFLCIILVTVLSGFL